MSPCDSVSEQWRAMRPEGSWELRLEAELKNTFWEGGGVWLHILSPAELQNRDGSTEAKPAVKPERKNRRGREMAGLPQAGETPLGFSFLNPNSKVFCPHFSFLGPEDLLCYSVISKPPREQDARRRDMLWDNKCKIFWKLQLCQEEVRETERTCLSLEA